jgi:hypothetical protein
MGRSDMPKFILAAAIVVALAGIGGWTRSTTATDTSAMSHAVAVDVFALQANATDLPVSEVEDFI